MKTFLIPCILNTQGILFFAKSIRDKINLCIHTNLNGLCL